MRRKTITEENFEKVLKRILRFTNKYKMTQFYSCFDKNMNLKYKNNDIGFKIDVIRNKKGEFKRKKKFVWYSSYLRVTKHHFREKFEKGVNDFDTDIYKNQKCLIHIDLNGGGALVLHENDKICFIPFLGFILWDIEDDKFDGKRKVYKYIYIIDLIKGKIKDINKENEIRDKEWEETAKWWNEHDNNYDSYDYF